MTHEEIVAAVNGIMTLASQLSTEFKARGRNEMYDANKILHAAWAIEKRLDMLRTADKSQRA